ncbi:uncharacterized protein V6R79_018218 [Siganus canaliculatus]
MTSSRDSAPHRGDAERNQAIVESRVPRGRNRPDPGPGVTTMRRPLKRDIRQLFAQCSRKINRLCNAGEQWKAFSHRKNPALCPICLHSPGLTTGPVWSLLD